MKNIKFILASLVAVAMFASCSKPANEPVDTPDTPTDPATLSIDDNYVQVKAAGGEYYFTYTLENPDGNELKVESQYEWVHSFDLSDEGEVSFVVDTNTTGSQRISKITLTYGKLKDSIVVTQSGEAVDVEISIDFEFDISFDELNARRLGLNPRTINIGHALDTFRSLFLEILIKPLDAVKNI